MGSINIYGGVVFGNNIEGATSDVTPNSVDWTNGFSIGSYTTNVQQITGIDSSITLEISWTTPVEQCLNYLLRVSVNTINQYGGAITTLSASPVNIIVNNLEYVSFRLEITGSCAPGITITKNVTVNNVSDNNTQLDTVTLSTGTTGA